ncbi:nicotinate-nucleotide adenylyltransferase [Effusibacillus lacus]|uniref:Probable nicotinate-nucleotide adenylyltransferase n=1 Tax=Effusibacillus lacus TaxID=1348429 RepID=A0A292YG00_9BACL|nr:nicotinate-nucleotide adenylyltransferase [Effusibacillus lacus]TCS72848.1 nicotinate-nucleotide adenylyltransferase [Effusibacillus lacus]GAX89227.1 nicotinate-nicotinamide nucleotide adenylyltransferase [Effusibacillus lacus]
MRMGLFGGTFDPIHIGHLVAARLAKEALQLDRVIFIPSGIPPHKSGREITPAGNRFEMVKLAVEQEPDFSVSDWEIRREVPSYTVDTLESFASQFPDDELYFIVGADMLYDFPNWHNPGRILEICQVIGMTRPGFALDECRTLLRTSMLLPEHRIHFVEMPGLEISSTWLRDRLRQRRSVHYLIPDRVIRFIEENGLYDRGHDS